MTSEPVEVSVYDAKTHLSRLLDRANAGEEIIVTRHGRPVARIAPLSEKKKTRRLGLMAGESYFMSEDFDAPLPEDVLAAFEGRA